MLVQHENTNEFSEKLKLIDYIDYLLVNDDDLQEQGRNVILELKNVLLKTQANTDNCYYLFKKDVPKFILENASCLRFVIKILRTKRWDAMYANGKFGDYVLIPPGEVSQFYTY